MWRRRMITVATAKGEEMASSKLTLAIDAEAVKNWLEKADMVPVVRCKDCAHYHKIEKWGWKKSCDLFNFDIDEDDFCSRGWKK